MTATIIPFAAPPLTRAVLQPSVHARGVRNYFFEGQIDDYHAPGALLASGGTRCAVDAAWLVERVLGGAKKSPVMFPGVPGVRERAIAFGQQVGLYPFQQLGAAFLAERDYALLTDQMGCVEGDAVIRVNRAGRGFPMTLRELYQRTAGLIGSWDPQITTQVRVHANGDLRLHPIKAVLCKGTRSVLRLVLKSGKTLRLTFDHEVGLPEGSYQPVAMLKPGDRVLTNGVVVCKRCEGTTAVVVDTNQKFCGYCRTCIYRYLRHTPRRKTGKFIDQDGYVRVSGQWDHPRRTTGGVYEHILVMEKHLGRLLDRSEEVHHKNEIRHDNDISNLELFVDGTEHHAHHGREGGFRHMDGGYGGKGGLVKFVPTIDEVVSVEPAGETDVYDIVCTDPHRNFVANGIVVHNCGKTGEALIAAEARLSLAAVPSPVMPVVLVLAPALAKRHWQREIKKWTGHEAAVLESLTPGPMPETRYVICNYDILFGGRRKDAAGVAHNVAHLPGWGPTLTGRFLIVILDEAHLLRGRSSRRTLAVRTLCRKMPVVWALTGTPVPNYVRDLWALLDLISDGLQGPYWPWAKAYCAAVQAQYGWVDTGSDRLDELAQRLSFFTLGRSTASVGMELPEKRRETFKIDVERTAPTVAEGNQALSTKSSFIAKALRITARAKRSAVVAQTIEALENKQKVVVFVYMREQADAVAKAVKNAIDCHVACVHGDLTPDGRDAQATVFREVAAPAAFIATIDSVGLAISLVGADLVLFGDLVPEPWKLLQAEKRCHRHGSTNRVIVRYLIATGTLDEGVAETVIEKLGKIESALGKEADQTELQGMLGGRSDESIVSDLFERLKTLKPVEDE